MANYNTFVNAYKKGKIIMSKNKHLTLQERLTIESELFRNNSFRKIGIILNKDCTSISKEVRKHITIKETGSKAKSVNNCIYRDNCNKKRICTNLCIQTQNKFCKYCRKCNDNCNEFVKEKCIKLNKPPYVCNSCNNYHNCRLTKHIYDGAIAYNQYINDFKESRTGITLSEKEIQNLNELLVPLIKEQKQSIHQAIINNKDKIMCSDKTIYKLIDLGILNIKNIDLPRKVRYRERRKNNKNYYKVDKMCLENKRYEDYLKYIDKNPDTSIVQIDSVEGHKGGKVLLTIHFCKLLFYDSFFKRIKYFSISNRCFQLYSKFI